VANTWWVNQGGTWKHEIGRQILWAPMRRNDGQELNHWSRLADVQAGDVIFHYYNKAVSAVSVALGEASHSTKPDFGSVGANWQEDGRLIHLRTDELNRALPLAGIPLDLRSSSVGALGSDGPFTRAGEVKQGYFFKVHDGLAAWLSQALQLAPDESDRLENLDLEQPQEGTELVIQYTEDGTATVKVRPEHSALKRAVFGRATTLECGLCGRELPTNLLVVAHIKRRTNATPKERTDPHIAMPACSLGCDALFERGYLTVDQYGRLRGAYDKATRDLRPTLKRLEGRQVKVHSAMNAKYFKWHKSYHSRST
jgi:hypothetical protein